MKSTLTHPISLFVGSHNPVKVNSVAFAIKSDWPQAIVKGYEVGSGVKAQPDSDLETRLGAANRARAALKAGLAEFPQEGTVLGLGLEGGIIDNFQQDHEMWSTVWVVVLDHKGQEFAANGARFLVPKNVADKIRQGEEMGVAASQIYEIENVKHKGGLIGILTHDFTNRTEEYSAIVRMAIGLWYGQNFMDFSG